MLNQALCSRQALHHVFETEASSNTTERCGRRDEKTGALVLRITGLSRLRILPGAGHIFRGLTENVKNS